MSILASNISFLSDRYVIADIQYNEYLPQTITYDLTQAFNTSTTIAGFLNTVPATSYMYTGISDCRITFVYSYGGIAEFYITKLPDNFEESWT